MGDVIVGALILLVYTAFVFTWFFAMFDIFARGDLRFWSKVLWMLAIVFIPVFGFLFYFLTRPKGATWFDSGEIARYAPGTNSISARDQTIGEIETLTRLRNEGTITDEEFTVMKGRVLAAG